MLCLDESLRDICLDIMSLLQVLFCLSHIMIDPVLFSIELGRELLHYIESMALQFVVPCQYLLLASSSFQEIMNSCHSNFIFEDMESCRT